MLFSSITFLYYFLPIVMLLYYLVPKRGKNAVLLAASMVFYGWGEIRFLSLMIAVILVGWLFGLWIDKERSRGGRHTKGILFLTASFNVLVLVYFKYMDFFISSFNQVFNLSIPLLRIGLPIGISFYIFQLMSYVVDVYRGEVKVQKNLFLLAAYISMFPQLIAGPIVRYSDLEKQLYDRKLRLEEMAYGIRRFILGLSKKVLLANTLGECCAAFRGEGEKDVLFFWLYGVCFMLHIYFDFSGYSDMAIGLGKLLGFSFPENFRYPYISASVTEFWRRWHISLGTWFRDYVYIPMGGNRVGRKRWLLNILTVWFLTGFWHGAAWNFIVWGLLFALLLMLEKFWLGDFLNKRKALSRGYVLFIVMLSFLIFDGESLRQALFNIGGLFGIGARGAVSVQSLYYARSYLVTILIAVVGSTPLPARLGKRLEEIGNGRLMAAAEPLVLAGLLILVTASLVDGSFNPFLYFRF